MAIEKEVIDAIKQGVDLVALVQAKGINLKKNGKSYFGLCPFHADKNLSLSINPTKNLWQCFGCGAAGDVIRFVELFDQVDFKEAVRRLSDNGFKRVAPKSKSEPPKPRYRSRTASYWPAWSPTTSTESLLRTICPALAARPPPMGAPPWYVCVLALRPVSGLRLLRAQPCLILSFAVKEKRIIFI